MKLSSLLLCAGALMFAGCAKPAPKAGVTREDFGNIGGTTVDLYTLTNASGAQVKITNYGGIITDIQVPDKQGKLDDVCLGFDKLEDYQKSSPYFGALIGRYGNRIGHAQFKLGGKTYTLAKNNGANSLHGGLKGFDKVLWKAEPSETPEGAALKLTYASPDGEEGYPGNLQVTTVYTWNAKNELKLDFMATTDKLTVVNLTTHPYFNLAGQGHGDVLGQFMQIKASKFTPIDDGLIPTGELKDVKGTPFDFTTPQPIGSRIDAAGDTQLAYGKGYDHNFVLDKPAGVLGLAARVKDPASGRVLEVETSQPGVQFYSGNFLDGTLNGKGGAKYPRRSAFCLEPQHFPDSPNKPKFPSTELKPGETYHQTIVYRFLTE
jgi:aldose 1-epimerase